MTKEQIILRGQAANRLLGDELFNAAVREIESECLERWKSSRPDDVAGREDAFRMQRCIGLLKDKLASWRDASQFEKTNIALIDRERKTGT